jgi:hypothetical protein
MLDLRAYRLGFAPVLAALGVLAFSLQGVPEPLEPASGTIAFDAGAAQATARDIVRAAPDREPGSEDAVAAADIVRQGFEDIAAGEAAEQRFTSSVDGDDVELRNVLLTLPGTTDRTILIVAERDERAGPGAPSSAAATGVLLELARQLGVTQRSRTLIFGSIDGAGAEGAGVRELLDALPDRTEVTAAVVISQPGAAASPPHLIVSSGGESQPSQELIRTAEETLASRAQASAGLDGAFGQIARLALPAAAGAQAALLAEDVDSVAISSAGEVPLPPDLAGEDALEPESLERFGAAVLALVSAFDAATTFVDNGPSDYVSLGDNTVPAWAISVLALALLAPPALMLVTGLQKAGRGALGWAAEWALVALAPLLALFALAFIGLIPRPEVPFDPGQFELAPTEVLALLVLAGAAVAIWWVLGLRRRPAGAEPATLGAAAGALCLAGCALAWLANPFLALVLAPLAHVVVVHATRPAVRRVLAIPVALVALLPLAAVVLHVAGALDWGASAPWQLVVLTAGGGLGLLSAVALAVALVATLGVVAASLGAAPQSRDRGRP